MNGLAYTPAVKFYTRSYNGVVAAAIMSTRDIPRFTEPEANSPATGAASLGLTALAKSANLPD